MKCVILQPSYIPWRGYFHQIHLADVFVFYDCVQYDKHGWRNRNKIKTHDGTTWLTIPVRAKGNQQNGIPISQIPVVWDNDWAKKHRSAIKHSYRGAPFFHQYEPLIDELYSRRDEYLADFTCAATKLLATAIGIKQTKFLRSSDLPATGTKSERLLSILTHLAATHYISGPSAADYLNPIAFAEKGISVEFVSYNYPTYPQRFGSFEPHVSILDLLLNVGPDAGEYIWGKTANVDDRRPHDE